MPTASPSVSRIADWLPRFDVSAVHSIEIDAPASTVDALLPSVDFGRSWIVRVLFRLRGLPTECRSLGGIGRMGFVPLEHRPGAERLYGLVGRFWTARGEIVALDAHEFRDFERPGYAMAAWSFACEESAAGGTRLWTETRVRCTDPTARRRFLRYWRVVGPFSGWIRRRMLQEIRLRAEAA